MLTDERGLPITAEDQAAVEAYDATVSAYMGYKLDTGLRLKAAMDADPQMLLANCLRGYFFLMMAHPVFTSRIDKAVEAAEAIIAARGATEREKAHAAALKTWQGGDMVAAAKIFEQILLEHPRDIVALRLAAYLHFYLGDSRNLRDCVARVLHAWDDAVPGYGFVIGNYAFGLEEAGDYGLAEAEGRRAVALNPADIWAVHAVSHVLEMQGRHRDGIAWVNLAPDAWADCNNFAYHVWWHLSLCHLELGQYGEVLSLYDARVRADQSDDALDMSNGAAMLWRLQDRGIDVGGRWDELADKAAARGNDTLLVFNDAHHMLSLAAAGRAAEAETLLQAMRATAAEVGTQPALMATLGVPLCEAIQLYAKGDYAGVVARLEPIRYQLNLIGGSHAQRDLFQQILIRAAMQSGHYALARAMLAERTALRPTVARGWELYADALSGTGDEAAAREAKARAEACLAA